MALEDVCVCMCKCVLPTLHWPSFYLYYVHVYCSHHVHMFCSHMGMFYDFYWVTHGLALFFFFFFFFFFNFIWLKIKGMKQLLLSAQYLLFYYYYWYYYYFNHFPHIGHVCAFWWTNWSRFSSILSQSMVGFATGPVLVTELFTTGLLLHTHKHTHTLHVTACPCTHVCNKVSSVSLGVLLSPGWSLCKCPLTQQALFRPTPATPLLTCDY